MQSESPTVEEATIDQVGALLSSNPETVKQNNQKLQRAWSRKEMRKMIANAKRMFKPKRGNTKALPSASDKRAKRKQQKLSRQINRRA